MQFHTATKRTQFFSTISIPQSHNPTEAFCEGGANTRIVGVQTVKNTP